MKRLPPSEHFIALVEQTRMAQQRAQASCERAAEAQQRAQRLREKVLVARRNRLRDTKN